ncbi:MAG: S8 family peptidase [Armatimonadetes bacterium]|nr:S8 family peptidase [Armatimonadota bacterium]
MKALFHSSPPAAAGSRRPGRGSGKSHGSPRHETSRRKSLSSLEDRYESIGVDPRKLKSDAIVPVLVSMPDSAESRQSGFLCRDCAGIPSEEVFELPLVNGFSVYADRDRLRRLLEALPPQARIALNHEIEYPDPRKVLPMTTGEPEAGRPAAVTRLPGIEKVWEKGFTGAGQTIAVIDSGIYPHPDLNGKVTGWVDLSRENRKRPADPFGHGTHVAGVLAGSGEKSAGKVKGVAPDAKLVGIRITTVAEAIKGLQWVIENREKYNINVVNLSLGDFASKSYKDDPWSQAVQKAIEAGLVVVVAGGNEGPDPKTISTPGIHPQAITVGAYDDKGTPATDDDSVASFSSRGPTVDGLIKPDILAPGVRVFGTLSPGSNLDVPDLPHIGKDYMAMSGTSQATPMISALAALLLQANPALKQADILEILKASAAKNLDDDGNAQGAGLVQADRALELAQSWPNRPA